VELSDKEGKSEVYNGRGEEAMGEVGFETGVLKKQEIE
jgi:hypothetical protein